MQYCRLLVRGVVQGVGFRPFVYRIAVRLGLAGSVKNTAAGVVIELEGPAAHIDQFVESLRTQAPALARIDSIAEQRGPVRGLQIFSIAASQGDAAATTLIPPDVAMCEACRRELLDPQDRRFGYPFINCTDCGPRFTIISGTPYDRALTTMRVFPMCPDCQHEYDDPSSRRFHAEPNACPRCGPRVWLADAEGQELAVDAPLQQAAEAILAGKVVAVKGLGGFHLAVDAANVEAVTKLRAIKQRDQKAFAVMAEDLEEVRGFAHLTAAEQALLSSVSRPIVLLEKRAPFALCDAVAPDNRLIGAMLCYSPLHHLLLRYCRARRPVTLVMTSANPSDEPIVRDNDEAVQRLKGIAEAYVFHNRDILSRADDSVAMHAAGSTRLIRRSRGYVPLPLALGRLLTARLPALPVVLGVGGDLKNTFAVTRKEEVFFGPHIGDLTNAATAAHFEEAVLHLCRLITVTPEIIAHDLHPDYSSTRLAARLLKTQFPQARLVAVQHHHAHILSCLAEHDFVDPVIGLALDGTGYGPDGGSWGGELLYVDGGQYVRLAHLQPLALPGGDRAVHEPWRIAVGLLCELDRADLIPALAEHWPHALPEQIEALIPLCSRHLGKGAKASQRSPFPFSTSLGRLFDVVSAILGVRDVATYEGEAAIALEHVATPAFGVTEEMPLRWRRSEAADNPTWILDTRVLLSELLRARLAGEPVSMLAAQFHQAVARALTKQAIVMAQKKNVSAIAMSGGVLQNRLLLADMSQRLEKAGVKVLSQSQVPSNDGGLALGQALGALMQCR